MEIKLQDNAVTIRVVVKGEEKFHQFVSIPAEGEDTMVFENLLTSMVQEARRVAGL